MRRIFFPLGAVLVAVAGLVGPAKGQTSSEPSPAGEGLLAGVVKVDITPSKPVKMSGYAGRTELSTGVHDPLSARVVALRSGSRRLILVSSDLIGFYGTYEPIRDEICGRFQLKPDELFLSSIHTHSAPTPTLDPAEHANNVDYTQNLKATLVEAVGRALEQAAPVQIGIGRGYSPVGCNRREKQADGSIKLGRNPYGPTDKEVLVVKLARPDGTPIAALFDYATHATAMGTRNLQVSGDVLGLAAQFVEKILAPSVTAPVFAGASGNIDPWFRVLPAFEDKDGWIPEPVLLGTLLGEEVVHVFRDVKTTSSNAEIKSQLVTLELPAKKNPNQAEGVAGTKALNLTVARVGDIAFVGLGCELLTEVGMAIKEGSPFDHTMIITHCNGRAGYLPPKELYPEGGYEVDRSGFAPEAAETLVQHAVEALRRLQ